MQERLSKPQISDYLLRLPLALFFAFMAMVVARGLVNLVEAWEATQTASKWLVLASKVANLLFLGMMFGLTVLRTKPVNSAAGLNAAFTAFFGSFLGLSFSLVTPAELPPFLQGVSIVMIIAGLLLSAWTVSWLGRALSVMPQARHLVMAGPYAVIRHPLYLCEELAVLGVMLAHFSPIAVVIAALHWSFQLNRMAYEEQVLSETFPEYRDYAARVPRLIPAWFQRARRPAAA